MRGIGGRESDDSGSVVGCVDNDASDGGIRNPGLAAGGGGPFGCSGFTAGPEKLSEILMAAHADDWGQLMAAGGFTDDDRRRFERVDLRVEDILKRMDELVARFRDVEVDIDELRGGKADKSDLSQNLVHNHETRIQLIENGLKGFGDALASIKGDLEPLKAWRWKQLGALGLFVALVEVLMRVIFK